MKNSAPIKQSKHDKLWLEELYKVINDNKRPSYRSLRARLYKSLPPEYNPDNIDKRLAQYKGEEITLEGVNSIDPKLDVFNKANKVIEGIKELLINSPEKEEVNVPEIAKITKLNDREVSLILRLVSPFGKFWNSASGSQEFQYGFSSIRMQNDNQIFDQYLNFTNIKDLMNKYYARTSIESSSFRSLIDKDEDPQLEKEVKLNPIFKSKIDRIDKKLCFVLMPFKELWSDEIYKLIRTTIESFGFQCLRADNLNGPIIIEDIWAKINQAGFIIADVTGKNPNVMYEVGIAHTVGRPTILLTQNISEIPFDFAHLRHISYRNSVSGSEEFRKKMKEQIDEIYKTERVTPVSEKLKFAKGILSGKIKKSLK